MTRRVSLPWPLLPQVQIGRASRMNQQQGERQLPQVCPNRPFSISGKPLESNEARTDGRTLIGWIDIEAWYDCLSPPSLPPPWKTGSRLSHLTQSLIKGVAAAAAAAISAMSFWELNSHRCADEG